MSGHQPKPSGRREANKDATRTALREAAQHLFSERGFEATTVRDIARAAKVTERTFYRYFDGKEGLLADETLAWMQLLHDRIRDRPASEPPLAAVKLAMLETAREARDGLGPEHLWVFSNQPRPFATIRRFTPRPLLRLERSIAEAILTRTAQAKPRTSQGATNQGAASWQPEYAATVVARVAVAALRSAVIHARNLEADRAKVAARLEPLLEDAFTILGEQATRLTEA